MIDLAIGTMREKKRERNVAQVLPYTWPECQTDERYDSSKGLAVQHISPQDVYYMCNKNPAVRSIVVSVFNFTLMGSLVNVCNEDEFCGPFLSYLREDDSVETLTERFSGVVGSRTDTDWKRYGPMI